MRSPAWPPASFKAFPRGRSWGTKSALMTSEQWTSRLASSGLEPTRWAGLDRSGHTDYSPILQATFETLEGVSLSECLDRIDQEYLRRTARSLLALLRSIMEASDAFDHALSRDEFGLRRDAMLDRSDRSLHAGVVLVWALVQERSRVGLAPTGKRRLLTAHAHSRRSRGRIWWLTLPATAGERTRIASWRVRG